jgi:hypothetical protein
MARKIPFKSLIDLRPGGEVSIMRPTYALRPGKVSANTTKRWRLRFDGTSVDVSRLTAVPKDQKLPSGLSR